MQTQYFCYWWIGWVCQYLGWIQQETTMPGIRSLRLLQSLEFLINISFDLVNNLALPEPHWSQMNPRPETT